MRRRNMLALGVSSLAARAAADRRTVVLTFDDGVVSHAAHVGPMLRRYGFGGTFFVCEFPPDFADKTKYMTWEQIAGLHRAGFEIGNHTLTHAHVNNLKRDQLIAEIEDIERRCAEHGIPKPVSFAYPAYHMSPTAFEVLREKGYRWARTGGSKPYEPESDDCLQVPSFSTSGTDRKRVLEAIEQARDGRIVVLTVHGVPDTAHPWVDTPPDLFEEYLNHLRDGGFRVIAMRDLK